VPKTKKTQLHKLLLSKTKEQKIGSGDEECEDSTHPVGCWGEAKVELALARRIRIVEELMNFIMMTLNLKGESLR